MAADGCERQIATPLRAIAVDDEPLAIDRLRIICAGIPEIDLIGTSNDAADAMRLIATLRPDLLLLDIAMPGVTGMEMAQQLAQRVPPGRAPAVIFVTAFDNFAVAAFDVAAADYLLKPVDPVRLQRAVVRARDRVAMADSTASPWLAEFWVTLRGDIVRIAAADVDYIVAERDYMRLHTGGRSFLIHETIARLETRLDPQSFVRIHRSVIVRRDRVAQLLHDRAGGWRVALVDGAILPVGRSHAAKAKAIAGR